MQFQYKTKGTCSQVIQFELEGDVVRNIVFHGGCNGNLKAISKLVDGMTVTDIEISLRAILVAFDPPPAPINWQSL